MVSRNVMLATEKGLGNGETPIFPIHIFKVKEGVNYNDPDLRVRLAYSSDFADWQHLNVKGSVTFSRRLGSDLKEMYELPDRRGEEAYATWQQCSDDWYAKFPDYRPETEE